jgi:hypothetical protein
VVPVPVGSCSPVGGAAARDAPRPTAAAVTHTAMGFQFGATSPVDVTRIDGERRETL